MDAGKHHNKKALKSVLIAAVVFAGGYYAYHEGLIPGVTHSNYDAEQLQVKIESMQGGAIEPELLGFIRDNSILSRLSSHHFLPVTSEWQDHLDNDFDMSFSYEKLEPGNEDGVGMVEISNPKITIRSKKDAREFDVIATAVKVYDHGGSYKYKVEGDLEVWTDAAHNGTKNKVFVVRSEGNGIETGIDGNGALIQNITAKNIVLMEGRGGTILIGAKDVNISTSRKDDLYNVKASYTGITPGAMISLFIGRIEPVDINIDYSYAGNEAAGGKLKVNDISLKMADSAAYAHADLEFKKESKNNLPNGAAYVRFDNYKKILTLLMRYYAIPPESMTNLQKFIMESGADEGDDVSFDLHFNGTKNITINGKSKQEFERIYNKHFPDFQKVEPVPAVEKNKLEGK